MKQLPNILNQQDKPYCQCYSTCTLLGLYGVEQNPDVLYRNVFEQNKKREPRIEDVLKYLYTNNIIQGYDSQMVSKIMRFVFTPLKIAGRDFYRDKMIVVMKNVCKFDNGGIISIRVDDSIKHNGVLTRECLESGGDHSVVLYDYDPDNDMFILINSWGTDYADHKGVLYLPSSLIQYIQSFYTITVKRKNK